MHELSIAEGIIDIVERTARANNVRRVKRVEAAVGELAAVDPAALFFAWESVRKGGPADAAELVLTPVPPISNFYFIISCFCVRLRWRNQSDTSNCNIIFS